MSIMPFLILNYHNALMINHQIHLLYKQQCSLSRTTQKKVIKNKKSLTHEKLKKHS